MANAKLKVIQESLVEELCNISKLPNMEITGCQERTIVWLIPVSVPSQRKTCRPCGWMYPQAS